MTTTLANSTYPAPVYIARNQAANGASAILDISSFTVSRLPPVLIGTLGGGTMTVQIQGSHDAVNWFDYSEGGVTADFSKDLIQGIRFWRVVVSGYASGTFNANVGAGPSNDGSIRVPNLYTVSTNIPAQAGV